MRHAWRCLLCSALFLGWATIWSTVSRAASEGACCMGESCEVVTELECAALQGAYQGDGTACVGLPEVHTFDVSDEGLTNHEYPTTPGYRAAHILLKRYALKPGDSFSFVFRVTSALVETAFGTGTSIGLADSMDYLKFIGIALLYDDFIAYRIMFGANGSTAPEVFTAAEGVTYRAQITYDEVGAHLELSTDGSVVFEASIPDYQPEPFDSFRMGIDYPGSNYCGDENYVWSEQDGRVEFCVDRNTGARLSGWIDDIVVPSPGCSLVEVSGSVVSGCGEGPIEGATVTLIDGAGAPHEAVTDAAGAFVFSAAASSNGGVLTITSPPGFAEMDPVPVALSADQHLELELECRFVAVSGTIVGCEGPVPGVMVDLLDADGVFHPAVADANGQYLIEGLRHSEETDAAEISIVIPLGYEAVTPEVVGVAVTLNGNQAIDFELGCLTPTGEPRSIGYWKHNGNVYLTGRGHAEESESDMTVEFPLILFEHFYSSQLASIAVPGITYEGEPPTPISLETLVETLTVNRGGTMLDRAKQHYLAFLLNVASGKIRTYDSVTEDGRTASQALQYVAALISDGLESNDEIAEDLAETINDGALLGAGIVPPEIPDIPYRSPVATQSTLRTAIDDVSPSPFQDHARIAFSLAHATDVKLDVYDVAGSRVIQLTEGALGAGEHEVVWNGRDARGRRISSGVYYIQLWADGRSYSRRVHLMR